MNTVAISSKKVHNALHGPFVRVLITGGLFATTVSHARFSTSHRQSFLGDLCERFKATLPTRRIASYTVRPVAAVPRSAQIWCLTRIERHEVLFTSDLRSFARSIGHPNCPATDTRTLVIFRPSLREKTSRPVMNGHALIR